MISNLVASSFLGGIGCSEGKESVLRRLLLCSLPYLAVTAFALLAWAVYSRTFPTPVFPVDDAYIVLHNARALLAGHDPNYVGSSPLTGATSLVHLALVSLLMLLFSPLTALSAVSWLSAILYATGLVRLARVHGASRLQALLVAAVGVGAGQTPHQLLNGLETGLMLAAITWALVLLSGPRQSPSPLLPALCGVLPFIRPDLTPLALLFLFLQVARRWRGRSDGGAFLRGAGADIGIAFVCALPWALWYQAELGSALPTTVAAKRYFFAEAGEDPQVKLATVMNSLSLFGMEIGLLTCFAGFLGEPGLAASDWPLPLSSPRLIFLNFLGH